MSKADSIILPNPEFDNNITVYGPEVRNLAKRYLGQTVDELRALPGSDGTGTLFDAIDLVGPHQTNQTTVTKLVQAVGLEPARLYFNIKRVGNTSSASIPIAIHDAVREGVINRPLRVFAAGFEAGGGSSTRESAPRGRPRCLPLRP